jgi:hypothetical protein
VRHRVECRQRPAPRSRLLSGCNRFRD